MFPRPARRCGGPSRPCATCTASPIPGAWRWIAPASRACAIPSACSIAPNRHRREIDIRKFRTLCGELRKDHDADAAHVEVKFPYFIEKRAPVTGAVGLVDYPCTFGASVTRDDYDLWVALEVPVTTLCPCSKAISRNGAHNQRSLVSVRVWFDKFFWIEDLIARVEESASCDLYALLKRPDEKYVTERAWARPRFVEDLVREVGTRLRRDANFTRWEVEAESFESIHAHSAYASLKHP